MALKYKVGDKVRIKSLDWYNENKDEVGNIRYKKDGSAYPVFFSKYMSNFCGEILTIKSVFKNSYYMNETGSCEFWTDEMIECAVNDKREHFEKVSNAIKNYYKERPCRDCGPGNGCDDCRGCEDGKRNWEMWLEVKKMITDYETIFNTSYEEDKKIFNKEPSPMFKIDDVVVTDDNLYGYITEIKYDKDKKSFKYYVSFIVDGGYYYEYQLKPHKSKNKPDMGEVSDGYHTFNELYEYRLLYNASFFNELAKQNLYDVHKSKKHSDGEDCFGGGWFVVIAELPTGQVSNHYELKDWDLFQVPEKEKANVWDGHTSQDVAKRMREFLTPKPKYPNTYEECSLINGCEDRIPLKIIGEFTRLINARNAYWKIAGEEMGLGKPWKPDWEDESDKFTIEYFYNNINTDTIRNYESHLLAFPTKEIRDAFYEAFKELIEECKELL